MTRGPRNPYTISASFGPALRYILARMPMMKISASTPSPTKRIVVCVIAFPALSPGRFYG